MLINCDGAEFYAYTANHAPDDSRDSVVFVHGAAMDHSVWSHQSRYFAYHGYNALALDLPGHGKSGGDALRDIGEIARWLRAVIASASLGARVHLVGHSMGALIALEAAAGFAESVESVGSDTPKLASLTLIGFSYPMAVTPQLLDAAANDPSAAYAMMTQWSHASQIGGEPVPGFWSPGMQMRLMESSRAGAIHADLTACNDYDGGERAFDAVANMAIPVLFLCGQRDRMAPAKLAQKHAARNDAAEIVFVPHCGHNLMAESPHQVLRALKRFIGGD